MRLLKYLNNYFLYLKSKTDNRSNICQICLSVSDQCNSRCTQCSAWKSYLLDPSKKEKEFKPAEIEKIIKNSNSLKSLNTVSLTGGEPILRQDLVGIAKIFKDNFKNIRFFLQSNGLNSKKLNQKAKEISSFADTTICISIDGLGSTHDKIRGVKGGFERTSNTIRELKKEGHEVSLSCNITPSNYLEIKKVWDKFQNKVDYFSCRPIAVGEFFKTSENKFILSEAQRNSVVKQLKLIKYAKNLFIYQVSLILSKQKRLFPCKAGFFSVIISPELDVYPCSACPADWCFGNLREVNYNLDALLDSPKGKKIKEKVRTCQKHKTEYCINEPEFFSTAHFQVFWLLGWLLLFDFKTLARNIFIKNKNNRVKQR